METIGNIRHQSIQRMTAAQASQTADAAIGQWDSAATQIIAIVGEAGFNSLYARSLFLSQSKYPLLVSATALTAGDHRFANLKASLQAVTPELANEANRMLLTVFTDILASLIGEQLTTRILDSAWSLDPHYMTGKEPHHE